jgi:hypothetical protein
VSGGRARSRQPRSGANSDREQQPGASGDDDLEPSAQSQHRQRKRMSRTLTQSPRRWRPEAPDSETTMTKAMDNGPAEAVDPVAGRPDPLPVLGDGTGRAGGGRPGPGASWRPQRRMSRWRGEGWSTGWQWRRRHARKGPRRWHKGGGDSSGDARGGGGCGGRWGAILFLIYMKSNSNCVATWIDNFS